MAWLTGWHVRHWDTIDRILASGWHASQRFPVSYFRSSDMLCSQGPDLGPPVLGKLWHD
jgi:hypothetical protein